MGRQRPLDAYRRCPSSQASSLPTLLPPPGQRIGAATAQYDCRLISARTYAAVAAREAAGVSLRESSV